MHVYGDFHAPWRCSVASACQRATSSRCSRTGRRLRKATCYAEGMSLLVKWKYPMGALVILGASLAHEELLHVPVPEHLHIEVEADMTLFQEQVLSVASTSESVMSLSVTSTTGQKVYLTVGYLP